MQKFSWKAKEAFCVVLAAYSAWIFELKDGTTRLIVDSEQGFIVSLLKLTNNVIEPEDIVRFM